MELEGKLTRKLPVQSGSSARGTWSKQEFILEYQDGNYPTSVCLHVWGEDKVKDLQRLNEGSRIKVSFSISSREFNGKWYTDLRAWRIEVIGAQQTPAPAPTYGGATSFGGNSAPIQTPPPGIGDMPSFDDDSEEDLPF